MGQANGKERSEDGSSSSVHLHHSHHHPSSSGAADANSGYAGSQDRTAGAAALHALTHSSSHHASSFPTASLPTGAAGTSSSSAAAHGIQLPPPDHIKKFPKKFDHGLLEPQGVYTGPQDYHHDIVKTLITTRKLAPFYKGAEDEETYRGVFEGKVEQTECPICFLVSFSPDRGEQRQRENLLEICY